MTRPTVMLSADDVGRSTVRAWRRWAINRGIGSGGGYGYAGNQSFNVAVDVLGDLGEIAVARFLGVESRSPNDGPDYDGDLSNGDEVRTTGWPHGHLIIHPEDPDDRVFWLVLADPPRFEIAGWCLGADGKRPEFRRSPRSGSYMVPQRVLRDPSGR